VDQLKRLIGPKRADAALDAVLASGGILLVLGTPV